MNATTIKIVKTILKLLGAIVIKSPEGEAEGTCCLLKRLGYCDYVISADSDRFAFGGIQLIKQFPP